MIAFGPLGVNANMACTQAAGCACALKKNWDKCTLKHRSSMAIATLSNSCVMCTSQTN